MQVKDDIMQSLNMKNPLIFSVPVFRPNLYYDVWFIEILDKPFEHLKSFIIETLGSQNESIAKVSFKTNFEFLISIKVNKT